MRFVGFFCSQYQPQLIIPCTRLCAEHRSPIIYTRHSPLCTSINNAKNVSLEMYTLQYSTVEKDGKRTTVAALRLLHYGRCTTVAWHPPSCYPLWNRWCTVTTFRSSTSGSQPINVNPILTHTLNSPQAHRIHCTNRRYSSKVHPACTNCTNQTNRINTMRSAWGGYRSNKAKNRNEDWRNEILYYWFHYFF